MKTTQPPLLYFTLSAAIQLTACALPTTNTVTEPIADTVTGPSADRAARDNQAPVIETFSYADLPDEVVGCSCAFSNDSTEYVHGRLIYFSDWQDTYMKINGVMTKLVLVDTPGEEKTTKYSNDLYEVTVETKVVESQWNGDPEEESSSYTGVLTLKYSATGTVVRRIHGSCGC